MHSFGLPWLIRCKTVSIHQILMLLSVGVKSSRLEALLIEALNERIRMDLKQVSLNILDNIKTQKVLRL